MKKKRFNKYLLLLIITISVPIAVLFAINRTSFFNNAFFTPQGTQAKLVINLTNPSSFQPNWGYFSQGGEDRNGMLTSVIEPVAKLKPRYIRIDHIFDFYDTVYRESNGQISFNWQKLDMEITAIRKTGATPFISLSYMPSVISAGNEVDLPVSWSDWSFVVKATIEHISGNNGLNIPNVYYEVWNEPDLFGEFKLTGDKNYLTLYQYAAYGARDARNTKAFKFGGPATTSLMRPWVAEFLTFIQKNNLRLDFYSWHRYSKYLADFENDATNARQWISLFPNYFDTELIITESGHNPQNDSRYDQHFAAIHTLAVYATTFDKLPNVYLFELKDGAGPQKYWGRWGILTNEKFGTPEAKPRYKAIEFLNRMTGSYYPIYGQGSWVKAIATTDGKIIRTLVVNYDPVGNHEEIIPVNFINLPSLSFTLRRTDFMGGTYENRVNLDSNNWSTHFFMKPNTAAIFEILPD